MAEFDILHTKITTEGSHLVFQQQVRGEAGKSVPNANGKLAGADVYSYVWPTKLNSSSVGFDADQGILALALNYSP